MSLAWVLSCTRYRCHPPKTLPVAVGGTKRGYRCIQQLRPVLAKQIRTGSIEVRVYADSRLRSDNSAASDIEATKAKCNLAP